MSERRYDHSGNLQEFYNKIAPIVEGDGTEAQLLVKNWNLNVFRDMRNSAETLMLMYGQSVSDRYLYGFCSALAAIKEENRGALLKLTDEQYELDREVQDSHGAAQDTKAAEYFYHLEEVFEAKFPQTSTILKVLEHDLRTRLSAPAIDIEEGFVTGWYRAVRIAVPLFFDEGSG